MTAGYRPDLSWIHDAGFAGHALGAASVLLAELERNGHKKGVLVDLGCGSGIIGKAAAGRGYDVLGVDISPAMIALARKRVPKARLVVRSLWEMDLPPCVAVAAVGECLNYTFDAGNSLTALAGLLRRIHSALAPRGLLLFDLAGPGRSGGQGVQRRFFEADDWAALVTVWEHSRHRFLTRRITSFRRVRDSYRRDQEIHQLRLVPAAKAAVLLDRTGFCFRTLDGYGSLRFGPGLTAFLAQKLS